MSGGVNLLELAALQTAPGGDLLGAILDILNDESHRIESLMDALIKTGQASHTPVGRANAIRALFAAAAILEVLINNGEAAKAGGKKPPDVIMRAIEAARQALIQAWARGEKDAPKSPLADAEKGGGKAV